MKLIQIDRTPFTVPNGLSITWQDKRSLALTEVDLEEISLETGLQPGETEIKSSTRLTRFEEANYILLDVALLFALNQDRELIPDSWKDKAKDGIFFEGTRVATSFWAPGVSPHRLYHCPGLCWDGHRFVKTEIFSDFAYSIAKGVVAVLKR